MAENHQRVGRIERIGRVEPIQRIERIEPAEQVTETKKPERYNADGKSFQDLVDEKLSESLMPRGQGLADRAPGEGVGLYRVQPQGETSPTRSKCGYLGRGDRGFG